MPIQLSSRFTMCNRARHDQEQIDLRQARSLHLNALSDPQETSPGSLKAGKKSPYTAIFVLSSYMIQSFDTSPCLTTPFFTPQLIVFDFFLSLGRLNSLDISPSSSILLFTPEGAL